MGDFKELGHHPLSHLVVILRTIMAPGVCYIENTEAQGQVEVESAILDPVGS